MSGDSASKLPSAAAIPVAQASTLGSFYSLSLQSTFPEDLEVDEYCVELLRVYRQRYVTFANCLVTYARPVKICQNCYTGFNSLDDIYKNISSDQLGPGNVTCHDSLMRSDRMMLLFTLYNNLQDIWTSAKCSKCLTEHQEALMNDTVYFMATLNQSLSCFEQYQKNHTELCKDCKASYKRLNELYGRMEKNQTLCIDLEDAMNMTQQLWSKTYYCLLPREETVPVIAVSSFMLFLPVIFYLSSFLHSEQKKRKLIHHSYDVEDFLFFKKNANRKRRKIRKKLKTEPSDNLQIEDDKRDVFNAVLQSLTISDFKSHFQLTPSQTEDLVRLLAPCEWTAIREERWTVWHAVLASLWALSTQESYHSVANRFHITESLICDQLDEFCTFVSSHLANEIHWPQEEEAEMSVVGFFSNVGLPDTLCVVGTCFIPCEKPIDVPDPEAYKDPKGSYSVKLMAFCNHKGRFTYVSAEHPRNWPNSRILSATELGKALQEDPMALLHGKHIIGNSTFALSEHFLTPFPDYATLGQKKVCYNQKMQSSLAVAQGSIHTLRSCFQRLRCLQLHSVCQTSLAVKTCCILYNMFLETYNVPVDCIEDDVTQKPFHELPYGHSGSLGGISKRQDIAASLGRTTKKRKCMYN
ncbi:osteopetrosis-associated transmembrane 1-like isoform X1 [Labeo rohita]|uniref:Osteopetrosis-associated transmembrane 1-like isoform X1 n=1 Tax=Labeo rohita TaxID=84645 RepID=A0A498MIG3_LABRO|nr:osteopetrosis-associated transmembrane 1-like isoform X1 [Labeo rohita]